MKFLSYGIIITVLLCIVSFTVKDSDRNKEVSLEQCEFDGKKLYGKIQLVEYASEADVKVKIVNSFADIKVKFVENFADECGEWQIVENGGDLKVYIAENFADIKIEPVTSFPGLVR